MHTILSFYTDYAKIPSDGVMIPHNSPIRKPTRKLCTIYNRRIKFKIKIKSRLK